MVRQRSVNLVSALRVPDRDTLAYLLYAEARPPRNHKAPQEVKPRGRSGAKRQLALCGPFGVPLSSRTFRQSPHC